MLSYRGLADVFGLGSYLPWRLALLATHLGACALVYVFAARRVGPWWALLGLSLVLVSRGWEMLLWPFQIGQALSVLAGLGALLLLDRRDLRGDIGASALLLVSLASSSYGPPFLLVAAVELLLSRRSGLWVLVAPAAAWIWWQETWNADIPAQGTANWAGFKTAVNIGWDIFPGGPAAALGTSFAVGRAIVLLLVALAVARMVLERRVHARLVGLIVGYFAYWASVGWARSELPNLGQSPRYLGLGVVLFVLAAVELFAGLDTSRWPERARARLDRLRPAGRTVALVAFAVAALVVARGVWQTADLMDRGAAASLRKWGDRMLAQEAAFGVGRPALKGETAFPIETSGGFALSLPLGGIEATVDRFGGTIYTGESSLLEPLARRPVLCGPGTRQGAGRAPAAHAGDGPGSAGGARARPPVRCAPDPDARVREVGGRCAGAVRVGVPAGGLYIRNASRKPLPMTLIRWSDGPGEVRATVADGGATVVAVSPRDGSRRAWAVELLGSAGTVCPLAAG